MLVIFDGVTAGGTRCVTGNLFVLPIYPSPMNLHRFGSSAILALLFANPLSTPSQSNPYRYIRVGNTNPATATPRPGFALMGGGEDLDPAFRWLCARAGGGDLLVLRSHGSDDYNPYIQKLCHLNSVATLVIPSRAAASDPFVAKKIRQASALFIAGGDQSEYINFWMNTPVQASLNEAITRGVPIGGTSAGLAVLGEYAYSAQGDKPTDADLDSRTAIANPYGPRIALVHGFLAIPILHGIITDTHFATRNRMGRLLVFLARLNEPGGKPLPPPGLNIRGLGVEQETAVLLDPDGAATVVGKGHAYFVGSRLASGVMIGGKFGVMPSKKPLTFGPYSVQRVAPRHTFNLKTWSGDSTAYTLRIESGSVHSTQPGGSQY